MVEFEVPMGMVFRAAPDDICDPYPSFETPRWRVETNALLQHAQVDQNRDHVWNFGLHLPSEFAQQKSLSRAKIA